MAAYDPHAALAWLRAYPPLPRDAGRIALVGGIVRDALLGGRPRELDLVIEGDAAAYARRLPAATVTVHDAFGTATAEGDGWRIDIAMARRERYPQPGALPVVEPATIEADLDRRDFTANAMAVTLGGELLAAAHALDDLGARRLRVLHDRSFVDDPTRVMRLARYAERLRFEVEPHTAALAAAADLGTLSGGRIGAELRLALSEPDPAAVLGRLDGKLPIVVDHELIAAALALAPADADRGLVVLAAVTAEDAWLERLEFTAAERAVVRAAAAAPLPEGEAPSAVWRAWRALPVEAVALAGARGGVAAATAARRWIGELRHTRLAIGGDDLIASGIPEGPEIGRRLARALERRLDGELAPGRDAELAAALADAG
jgi:tRNA nucleotidyltransferase (CCA-adding enzyme)